MGVRGLITGARISVLTSILYRLTWLKSGACVCVCVCVICAPASVGVCGWGQGIAIPHTAVLSLQSPLSILSAELLLVLNLSFWGRGREFSQIPTVRPSTRHGSFKTRPSLVLLREGVILWARP